MDERSPRQPDSSGPPEDSDGTEARQSRPENPYRIPQRPPGARPTETGDFGFEHPRPADPVAPSPSGPSTPAEPWDPRQGQHETTAAAGTPDEGRGGSDGSWGRWDDPVSPTPVGEAWDASAREPAWGQPAEPEPASWETPDPEPPSWDRPAEPEPASWETPEPEPAASPADWHTPAEPYTAQESWSAPAEPQIPDGGWNTPSEPQAPQQHWAGTPEPHASHQDWNDAGAAPQQSWGHPEQSEHPETPWPVVGHGPDQGWGAPTEGSYEPPRDWNTPAEPPAGPSAVHESWHNPGTGPQQSWDQPSGHGQEAAGTQPQTWETPYGGQPAYQGDTPYPGTPLAPNGPQEGENRSDSFEFLYSGAVGPSGPQGYGGPEGHGGSEGYGGHGNTDGYDSYHGHGGYGGPGGPDGPDDPYGDDYDPGPPPPRKKSRRGLVIGVVAAVVVLALVGGAAGWYVYTLPQPEEATAEFEAAWEEQDYARLADVTTGDNAEATFSGIDSGLGVDSVDVEVGDPNTDGGTGTASYEVTVSLTNADNWGWEGELPLLREDGEWWVDFSPEVAYPDLGEGEVLARTAVWGERGQILATDGTRIDGPDASGSMQMIAGSLGEADEDDVERLGPAYSVGDTVGVSGLQRTHEEHLAGEAATTIVMVDAAEAEDPATIEATEDNTIATLDGSDGEDITTSIDMGVQSAAANAIIEADDPTGMVAVRPSTGEILAAVNVPGGFNRAFEGQYAPGSSFKIVTYSSLLDNGMSVDTTMDCPEEYELGGWPFRNAGNAEYGEQSVTEAFATSCNTALVHEVGEYLSPETLQASAEQFGMNAPMDIGVTAQEPTFPPVDSTTMMGSQGIGQGQILTSPLHMATVPAAIADGSWRQPLLVTEPAQEDVPEPTPIGNAEAIQPMMRAVITEGTAEDIDFEGEVFGKTGTAEFGTEEDANDDDELPSHAWMVGYKDDVAFALVVEGGGGGSAVAGPLAAEFTNAL
ncbi:penicillin-binding transpeptidase domain-containing protein [Nocardiopsis nanhaiensis]